MKKTRNLKAFTLAETMIVVVVLGIIATLTIPALVNKNKESVAKTKVRKAMAAYESALNKMIIENDLKSDDTLTAWANTANCPNTINYFKKVQGDGCIFKTSDGIWWNISNIERPVISFKEINNGNAEQITTNANNANDKTAFILVGRFGNDGSLRVDDLAYETANSIDDANGYASKAQVEKLYNLLGLKSSSAGGDNQSPFAACNGAEICEVGGITYTKRSLPDHTETYCTFDEVTGENSCDNVSTSTAGDYYVVNIGYPDDYDEQAHNYDGSTCQECIDNNEPDYYNAAKRYCKSSGGRLPTIAELKSLASQGLPTSYYWTSEEYDGSNNAYMVFSYGDIGYRSKGDNYRVLCIGQ